MLTIFLRYLLNYPFKISERYTNSEFLPHALMKLKIHTETELINSLTNRLS